jgi:hypothetical protein
MSKPIIAYKKAIHQQRHCIVTLSIPPDALHNIDRESVTDAHRPFAKHRCSKAYVMDIEDAEDSSMKYQWAYSCFHRVETIHYVCGKMIFIPNFDCDLSKVCVPGIHFFLDRSVALTYHEDSVRVKDGFERRWNQDGCLYLEKLTRNGQLILHRGWYPNGVQCISQIFDEKSGELLQCHVWLEDGTLSSNTVIDDRKKK